MNSVKPEDEANWACPAEASEHPKRASEKEDIIPGILAALDSYVVEPRPANLFGCFVSALILPCIFIYAYHLYDTLVNAPLIETNNIRWSAPFNPHPINITCHHPTGCYLSYDEENTHSECIFIPAEETVRLHVYQKFTNTPTMYVLTENTTESMASAHSLMVQKVSDKYPEGVALMTSPMYAGYMLAALVHTHNKTVKSGHPAEHRHEWFFTRTHIDPTIKDFRGGTCIQRAESDGLDLQFAQQAMVTMNPDYNFIEVEDGFSWLDFIGTTSGMYGLFISGGAIILSVIELDVWRKWFMKQMMVGNEGAN